MIKKTLKEAGAIINIIYSSKFLRQNFRSCPKKVVTLHSQIVLVKKDKSIIRMDFKSGWMSFCDCTLRFVSALLWLAFLCAFSFYDLFDFMIHTSNHSISMEIVNEMQELKMIVANVGLIGMAYLDNMLSSMMTGKNNESRCQKLVMLVSIIVAIYLSLMSQGVDIAKPNFRWENLPLVLFVVYLCSLLIYKMQSLEVVHSNGKSF